ncbi:MAG TPA: helix-turn-helix transcriptional regulator [Candidatus Binatia bacterium]|nr:helix-turn-helix transcriptional regulator [Candidatus Binatia bacterium]
MSSVRATTGLNEEEDRLNNPIIHTQMLQHGDVWRGIDRLAAKHGLSASGLARRAGLDPTAFNPSKRITREGRPRWPSTESVAKILAVTGESFGSFVQLTGATGTSGGFDEGIGGRMMSRPTTRALPIIALERLGEAECFSPDGQPKGDGWGRMSFGSLNDRGAFAIEISGRDLDPIYRDGDVVVVSPTAEIRRGDRVVVQGGDGTVRIRRVGRQDADGVLLEPVATSGPGEYVPMAQTRWIARILWASQ